MLFLSYSPSRSSVVSVVFDFNASLNDVAPLFLILSPDFVRMRVYCLWTPFVCCFVRVHDPDRVQ